MNRSPAINFYVSIPAFFFINEILREIAAENIHCIEPSNELQYGGFLAELSLELLQTAMEVVIGFEDEVNRAQKTEG